MRGAEVPYFMRPTRRALKWCRRCSRTHADVCRLTPQVRETRDHDETGATQFRWCHA